MGGDIDGLGPQVTVGDLGGLGNAQVTGVLVGVIEAGHLHLEAQRVAGLTGSLDIDCRGNGGLPRLRLGGPTGSQIDRPVPAEGDRLAQPRLGVLSGTGLGIQHQGAVIEIFPRLFIPLHTNPAIEGIVLVRRRPIEERIAALHIVGRHPAARILERRQPGEGDRPSLRDGDIEFLGLRMILLYHCRFADPQSHMVGRWVQCPGGVSELLPKDITIRQHFHLAGGSRRLFLWAGEMCCRRGTSHHYCGSGNPGHHLGPGRAQ